MRHSFRSLVSVLGFLLLASGSQAAEIRAGKTVELSGSFDDAIFAGAGEVRATKLRSKDDLIVAGGEVDLIGSQIQENVFVAGGSVSVQDTKAQDLIAAAGNLSLRKARVGSNLIAAGGNITLNSGTEVGGSLVLAGGDVTVEGGVHGDAWIAGGTVTLSGRFDKNVSVRAGKLVVTEGTAIRGNFRYSAREADVSPKARIGGRTEPIAANRSEKWAGWMFPLVLYGFLFALGCALLPILAAIFLPKTSLRAVTVIRTRFWHTAGVGALLMLIAPAAWGILFVSGIGTPIALIAVPVIALAWVFALVFGNLAVADQLSRWIGKKAPSGKSALFTGRGRWAWPLLAGLVWAIVTSIPGLGSLAGLLLWAVGLGSVAQLARGLRER